MQIELTIPTVYECEGVRLIPGMNEVADNDALAKFKANKLVKADIEAGVIVMPKPAKAETKSEAKTEPKDTGKK